MYHRRVKELQQLASNTGWDVSKYADYVEEYAKKAGVQVKKGDIPAAPIVPPVNGGTSNNDGGNDGNGNAPDSNSPAAPDITAPINPMQYVLIGALALLIGFSLVFGHNKKAVTS